MKRLTTLVLFISLIPTVFAETKICKYSLIEEILSSPSLKPDYDSYISQWMKSSNDENFKSIEELFVIPQIKKLIENEINARKASVSFKFISKYSNLIENYLDIRAFSKNLPLLLFSFMKKVQEKTQDDFNLKDHLFFNKHRIEKKHVKTIEKALILFENHKKNFQIENLLLQIVLKSKELEINEYFQSIESYEQFFVFMNALQKNEAYHLVETLIREENSFYFESLKEYYPKIKPEEVSKINEVTSFMKLFNHPFLNEQFTSSAKIFLAKYSPQDVFESNSSNSNLDEAIKEIFSLFSLRSKKIENTLFSIENTEADHAFRHPILNEHKDVPSKSMLRSPFETLVHLRKVKNSSLKTFSVALAFFLKKSFPHQQDFVESKFSSKTFERYDGTFIFGGKKINFLLSRENEKRYDDVYYAYSNKGLFPKIEHFFSNYRKYLESFTRLEAEYLQDKVEYSSLLISFAAFLAFGQNGNYDLSLSSIFYIIASVPVFKNINPIIRYLGKTRGISNNEVFIFGPQTLNQLSLPELRVLLEIYHESRPIYIPKKSYLKEILRIKQNVQNKLNFEMDNFDILESEQIEKRLTELCSLKEKILKLDLKHSKLILKELEIKN